MDKFLVIDDFNVNDFVVVTNKSLKTYGKVGKIINVSDLSVQVRFNDIDCFIYKPENLKLYKPDKSKDVSNSLGYNYAAIQFFNYYSMSKNDYYYRISGDDSFDVGDIVFCESNLGIRRGVIRRFVSDEEVYTNFESKFGKIKKFVLGKATTNKSKAYG